jgi:predicted unusual protein kinase regulating ubiquinone biosynthesis (AarF/ABC1/UbiB family)
MSSIRSGILMRGLALAKLTMGAGSRLASHKIENLFSGADPSGQRLRDVLLSQAKALAEELGQLKGSVMKVGQMLSVYGEHFLPPEVNSVLKSLQFQSPPLEWKAIEKCLLKELGPTKLKLLNIDETPTACASLGQVHKAVIKKTGQVIALKIQYPGVDKAIESDIKALRMILGMAQMMPLIPHMDHIFDEVKQMLWQEVDYTQELAHTIYFKKAFASDPRLIVPDVFPEFSSSKVLATSFEEGVPVDSAEVMALSQERRNALSRMALDVYFRELFVLGHVQTDPHLGNYRVRIDHEGSANSANDQLVLLDFGALRKFDDNFLSHYHKLVQAALRGDHDELIAEATNIKLSHPDDDENLKRAFSRFCFSMVEPFTYPNVPSEAQVWFNEKGDYDWHGTDLPTRLTKQIGEVILKYRLRAPPREIIFLDRKIGGVFIFLSVLRAQLNARPQLDSYLNK